MAKKKAVRKPVKKASAGPRKRKTHKKVRAALVGAGSMANSVHYPSLARMDDVDMVALCDLVPDKLRETAEKFHIEKTYSDYKKMIEDTAPDCVYVLMPPYHLFDVARHVLEQGVHLFIEKPPAVTTFQSHQLALSAEKHGCITMAGFQRRHIPMVCELRRRCEQHGPLHQSVCTFYKYHGSGGPYYGGAIDILTCDCIHAVDTLRWLGGGQVKRVASDVRCLYADFPTVFNAMITFESGMTGILLGNWMTGRRFFTVEMHAKGISAFADPDDHAMLYADGKLEGERFDPAEVAGDDALYMRMGFYSENRHFIDCVKAGNQPTSNLEDATKTMELVDLIYQNTI